MSIFYSVDGRIQVFSEADKRYPLISAVDEAPLRVQYVSFASWGNSRMDFFYDCT